MSLGVRHTAHACRYWQAAQPASRPEARAPRYLRSGPGPDQGVPQHPRRGLHSGQGLEKTRGFLKK